MNNLRIDQTTSAQQMDAERAARAARDYLGRSLAWERRLHELRSGTRGRPRDADSSAA